MTIAGLYPAVREAAVFLPPQSLEGWVLGIDGDFHIMRTSLGRKRDPLRGFVYWICSLVECGIKPLVVFDGLPHRLKKERRAAKKLTQSKAQGRSVTTRSFLDSLEEDRLLWLETYPLLAQILEVMGIPVVQAAGEADAALACLNRHGVIDAVASDDVDALVFGAKRIVRQLSFGEGIKQAVAELIETKDVLELLDVSGQGLIEAACLCKNDYNVLDTMGLRKALKTVTANPSQQVTLTHTQEEIRSIFNAPSRASPADLVTIATPSVVKDLVQENRGGQVNSLELIWRRGPLSTAAHAKLTKLLQQTKKWKESYVRNLVQRVQGLSLGKTSVASDFVVSGRAMRLQMQPRVPPETCKQTASTHAAGAVEGRSRECRSPHDRISLGVSDHTHSTKTARRQLFPASSETGNQDDSVQSTLPVQTWTLSQRSCVIKQTHLKRKISKDSSLPRKPDSPVTPPDETLLKKPRKKKKKRTQTPAEVRAVAAEKAAAVQQAMVQRSIAQAIAIQDKAQRQAQLVLLKAAARADIQYAKIIRQGERKAERLGGRLGDSS